MLSAELEASPTWDRGDSVPCTVEKHPQKTKEKKQNPTLFSETPRTLNPNSAVSDQKDSHGALDVTREMQPPAPHSPLAFPLPSGLQHCSGLSSARVQNYFNRTRK